ncbi:hypothetical protein [Bacillus gobiensis]|uniref:hypothetical protein n=1 Tax=Bacillus gobiensis TaxID=1441095 RepID=UPI003D192CB8
MDRTPVIFEIKLPIQQKEYAPKGYVDLDLEWFSSDKVIVARTIENKVWKEGSVPTMLTALYAINIRTEDQKQISIPKNNEIDEDPQVIGSFLTWFRKKANDFHGDVWGKNGLSGQEHIWLKNVDYAPIFFTPN